MPDKVLLVVVFVALIIIGAQLIHQARDDEKKGKELYDD